MKTVLSILFIIVMLNTSMAKWSPNPYEFNGVSTGLGTPFTKSELALIKKYKIKRINIPSGLGKEDNYVEFLFDDNYLLDSSYWYFYGKKGRINSFKISFEFDIEKRLVSSHTHMGENFFLDSAAYDKFGRLIYLKNSPIVFGNKNKNNQWPWIQEYQLLYSDSNKVIIVKSSDRYGARNKFYVNNKNENYMVWSEKRIDSISYDDGNKNYWYKYNNDSIFRIGLNQIYENHLLKTETRYGLFYENIIKEKMVYIYNDKNQLMRSYNELNMTKKKFYFYNEFGLVREEINVSSRGESDITKYDYFHYR